MSNGDHVRKSHIHRIYQNDDITSPIWVDVERLDEFWTTQGTGYAWQEKHWVFDWASFNPDTAKKKTISDPNDKSSTIDVPVRDKVTLETGSGYNWQAYIHNFVNTADSVRSVNARKVYHYAVPDGVLDENKQPPRNPDDYLNSLGDRDNSQYVRTEVIVSYRTTEGSGFRWQEKNWKPSSDGDPLLKDPLKDGEPTDDGVPGIDDENGDGDVDPPWRLDPLQNIVNVSWLRPLWFAWANTYGTHYSTRYELNCFCDPTVSFPDIPPEDFPPGFGYTLFTGASEVDTELGLVYRSEDGFKWERIDLSGVFNNGIGRIDNFNGYLIAQGSMARVEGVNNTAICNITNTDPNHPPPVQPPPPFEGPCDGGGTFVNFGVAAMESQDQGRTWQLIDSSFDYGNVGVHYDKDQDPRTITVSFGGPGIDLVVYNITIPWKVGEIRQPEPFPFRGLNGGVGNTVTVVKSTLSVTDPGSTAGVKGFNSTIETSTDGGKTFKTTLSLSDTLIVGPDYMRPSPEALKVGAKT
jgi:hypothetical protein